MRKLQILQKIINGNVPKARAKNCTFEKFHSEKFRYLFLNGQSKNLL